MADNGKRKTKLLDQLESGPWPSFVTEIKKASESSPVCDDLLGQLELSYEEKQGHWKHGGIVGVLGYGGGGAVVANGTNGTWSATVPLDVNAVNSIVINVMDDDGQWGNTTIAVVNGSSARSLNVSKLT